MGIVAIIATIFVGIFGVLWRLERFTRIENERFLLLKIERQEINLARKAIEKHMPLEEESSHFWPYEDVVKAAFGEENEEQSNHTHR